MSHASQHHILIVDRNAVVIQALRAGLRSRGWHVADASSAIAAVEVLGQRPWTAVLVGDPDGPRNGEQFLSILRQIVPRLPAGLLVERIDPALHAALRAGGALGCILKTSKKIDGALRPLLPTDPMARSGIRVVLSPRDALELSGSIGGDDPQTQGILDGLRGFRAAIEGDAPSLPARGDLLPRLQALTEGEPGAAEVAAAIEPDPTAVVAVLHAANAAGAGFATRARSIRDACVRLGTGVVLALGQQVAIRGCLELIESPWREAADDWWRHTEVASQLGRQLAPQAGLRAEDGFLAGLLSNIGELAVLVQADRFGRGDAAGPLFEAARAVMDREHGRLGEALLTGWEFGVQWRLLAARHHTPAEQERSRLARLAVLCWGLTLEQGLGYLGHERTEHLDRHLARRGCDRAALARSLGLNLSASRAVAAATAHVG